MTARASDSMFLCIDFVHITNCFYDDDYMWRLGRWTCNREVAGTSPGRSTPIQTVGKLFTHVSLFTKQYKLVPAQAGSYTDTPHDTLALCQLRAIETEISTALWAIGPREGL